MEQKKIMKLNINRSALCTVIFIIFAAIMGPALKIPYAKSIMMVVTAGLLLYFNREHLPEGWPIQKKMPLANFLVVLGIFGGFQALSGFSTVITDMYSDLSSIVWIGIITPLTEEIVFRGVVLNRLKKHGIMFGLIASSILFGVYHLNVIQIITGMLLGLILGYVSMNYSIVYSVILHIFNNFIMAMCAIWLCERTGITSLKGYIGLGIFVVGVIAAIIIRVWDIVIQFFKDNVHKSEKGCYKAFFLNPIVLVLLVVSVVVTFILAYFVNTGVYSITT